MIIYSCYRSTILLISLILTKIDCFPHNIARYMKVLKGFVSNYARPEGSIAQRYLSVECVRFCETFLNKTFPNLTGGDIKDTTQLEERPLSAGISISLDEKYLAIAHRYVLFNLAVVEPFLE